MITVTTTNHWRYVILAALLLLVVLVVTVRELRAAGGPPLKDLEVVEVSSDINTDTTKFVTADCPSGKVTTGGDYVVLIGAPSGDPTQIHVSLNSPTGFVDGKPVSWTAGAFASSTAGTWGIVATAICTDESL